MVWIRSEYAGELAVVFAWLSVLVPWDVRYVGDVFGGSVLFVRFPLLQLQYVWGSEVAVIEGSTFSHLGTVIAAHAGQPVFPGYVAWGVAAALVVITAVYGAGYYLREDRLETWPIDPVRTIGALLCLSAIAFSVAIAVLLTRGIGGVPVPIGVLLLFVFGGTLLRADRR
ncbi:MAG: DUF7549 family protein [Halobacteriota archaeon]